VAIAAAAAAAAGQSLFRKRGREDSALFQRVQIYYNRVWNRGEIVESYAVGEDDPSEPGSGAAGAGSRSDAGAGAGSGSVDIEVYVRYDIDQSDLQCSDEWLVLDCSRMKWRQPGFGGGGFRLLR
jgi:hypothetical protein